MSVPNTRQRVVAWFLDGVFPFLLSVNAGNRDATLAETAGKLADIRNILHDVTKTLEGYDPMQYARAYTGGAIS